MRKPGRRVLFLSNLSSQIAAGVETTAFSMER
jgi:hypothetical protein